MIHNLINGTCYNDDVGLEEKSAKLMLDRKLHKHGHFLRNKVRNKWFMDGEYKVFLAHNQIKIC